MHRCAFFHSGAACPQDLPSFVQFNAMLGLETPAISASEDCLFLEVYTPSLTARRPVMVWIHGGGLTTGENTFMSCTHSGYPQLIVILVYSSQTIVF